MPRYGANQDASQHRVVESGLIHDFDSPEADAVIRLQTNIDFSNLETPVKCYAITSAQEAEGKTTMACNLALLYAEKGLKVALLDLDLRQPAIHKLFHLENKIGIVEYVKGEVDSLKAIAHTAKGVDVITSGSHTPFPSKVLSSARMKKLLKELKEAYDYVILDTPPILVVSDAFMVGQDVDGFLLVCSQHISRKKDVVAACHALAEKNIDIIGITMSMVTTDEDNGRGGYGGYAYGYGYGYGLGTGYGYRHYKYGYGGYHAKRKSEVETEEDEF